jgi:hypothetical protein
MFPALAQSAPAAALTSQSQRDDTKQQIDAEERNPSQGLEPGDAAEKREKEHGGQRG